MSKKNTPSTFGDVRSLLNRRPVTATTWNKLARALYFFDSPEVLEDEVYPYCDAAIKQWPAELERSAPPHWLAHDDGREREAFHPALCLATALTITHELSATGADALASALAHGHLTRLDLMCPTTHHDRIMRLLQAPIWSQITHLTISSAISEEALDLLWSSPWVSDLDTLRLERAGLTDADIITMAERDRLHGLRTLSLDHNAISSAGVRALQRMESLGNVEILSMLDNAITRMDADVFLLPSKSLDAQVLEEGWDEYYWDAFE